MSIVSARILEREVDKKIPSRGYDVIFLLVCPYPSDEELFPWVRNFSRQNHRDEKLLSAKQAGSIGRSDGNSMAFLNLVTHRLPSDQSAFRIDGHPFRSSIEGKPDSVSVRIDSVDIIGIHGNKFRPERFFKRRWR